MKGFLRASTSTRRLGFILLMLAGIFGIVLPTHAQPRSEYRAFWIDTFNTTLNTHNDIVTAVNLAKAANANALFAQVRRRGDAWYLNSLEPPPDPSFIAPGFDPLADLIATAHANGIEVHAFVIVGAVWNKHPTILGVHPDSRHVFTAHGGYDPATGKIVTGPNNWMTRTLLPDGGGITFQGHRFGSEFWIDFGHPDAAEFTVNVLMHLASNYDIDGLHLDRIRYPEFTASGQTPSNGTNIGYNPVSVERFNTRHGRTGNPTTGDPLWMQWRRDQVTNIVRRIYLNMLAVKPQMKLSGAFIAFGNGPTTEATWNSSEAYWRVYQDWRAWTEEGIIDIAVPMNYKREHDPAQVLMFDRWNEWTKNHQYNRSAMIGPAIYLNAIEGSLRQTRRSLEPSATGNRAIGAIFYSMATTDAAVINNPFAIPVGNTPDRSPAEFASGLTNGKSVDGATLYEPAGLTPIFAEKANIPVLPWKIAPTTGHIKGFAKRSSGTPLDTAAVTIMNIETGAARTGATDGGGFYGGVDLAPGQYVVKAVLGQDAVYSCVENISAGAVTTADLAVENTAPMTSATVSPAAPNGANGWYVTDVQLNLAASDSCTGVERTEYSIDGGATWIPYGGTATLDQEGAYTVLFRSVDRAGNVEDAGSLDVKIDKTAPSLQLSASPEEIWPPDGQLFDVALNGNGADAVSGLSQVSYSVTDEYGMTFTVDTRSLSGSEAAWAEILKVVAARRGDDLDGRRYTVTATVMDAAGHSTTATTEVVVVHDQRSN